MRRSNPFAAAVLFALACTPAIALEVDEVSAVDCFIPTFKAGDADAVTACYAPDAVLWVPGGPMAKGAEQIRGAFAWYFDKYTIKDFTVAPMGWHMVGEDKVTWGTFSMTTVDKATGAEATSTGRYTDVSRRIDGKWLYTVDHASDDPPPAPQPAPEPAQ